MGYFYYNDGSKMHKLTERAIKEDIGVSHRSDGKYRIDAASGNNYTVDLYRPSCTCPFWKREHPDRGCKHIRSVDFQIQAGKVESPAKPYSKYVNLKRVLSRMDAGSFSAAKRILNDDTSTTAVRSTGRSRQSGTSSRTKKRSHSSTSETASTSKNLSTSTDDASSDPEWSWEHEKALKESLSGPMKSTIGLNSSYTGTQTRRSKRGDRPTASSLTTNTSSKPSKGTGSGSTGSTATSKTTNSASTATDESTSSSTTDETGRETGTKGDTEEIGTLELLVSAFVMAFVLWVLFEAALLLLQADPGTGLLRFVAIYTLLGVTVFVGDATED